MRLVQKTLRPTACGAQGSILEQDCRMYHLSNHILCRYLIDGEEVQFRPNGQISRCTCPVLAHTTALPRAGWQHPANDPRGHLRLAGKSRKGSKIDHMSRIWPLSHIVRPKPVHANTHSSGPFPPSHPSTMLLSDRTFTAP